MFVNVSFKYRVEMLKLYVSNQRNNKYLPKKKLRGEKPRFVNVYTSLAASCNVGWDLFQRQECAQPDDGGWFGSK